MRRVGPLSVMFACVVAPVWARHDVSGCGTTRETANETLFLHRRAVRARLLRPTAAAADAAPPANRDIGNIAVIEDAGGVVERLNQFNLDNNTLTFTPIRRGGGALRQYPGYRHRDRGAAVLPDSRRRPRLPDDLQQHGHCLAGRGGGV
jgi:hypothetical protein